MSSVEMRMIGRLPVSVAGVGCNNFGRRIDEERSHAVVAAALDAGINVFDTAENEYSLLERGPELEVMPACMRYGMSLMPYFPLASGMLSGKYRRGQPPPEGSRLARPGFEDWLSDERLEKVERLAAFAEA